MARPAAIFQSSVTPLDRIRSGGKILAGVVFIGVLGYRYLGGYGWSDAVWMVVITISTVGYGEHSQSDALVKWFTVLVIVFGMTASVYTFGGLFSMILEGELDRVIGRQRMNREIAKLNGHVIVCGYGRMGQHLVDGLRHASRSMVIIDIDEEAIAAASEAGLLTLHGDATNDDLLTMAGIAKAETLVITLPDDADNVFITLTGRGLNSKFTIIARAEQVTTEKKLRQAGADRVVMPTIVGAKQMTRLVARPSTADLIDVVTESSFKDIDLDEVLIPTGSPMCGRTIRSIVTLQSRNLLIVGIQRDGAALKFNPNGDDQIHSGETLLILGHPDNILAFRRDIAD
ncbi:MULTISPECIES: potassium channel family protein [Crateriforma]|uniref:Glutathione-regulated potassium-efflux system protein KefC n=1 Tax=Crateriforma conspicua TaxID=2527996 RepID=A0A5C6FSI9_9PLAN|nr:MULTISPECIES: potassium channel protein [Crateriforma]TWU65311.1 Glutathione-regulated potassium-efflux system protein KefC [Crateriforma conspicua]